MRSKLVRVLAVLGVVAMIAAACSKPKSTVAKTSGPTTTENLTPVTAAPDTTLPDTGGATTVKAGTKTTVKKGTATNGAGPKGAASAIGGVGDDAQAHAVGDLVRPITTQRAAKPYRSGVGDDTIQIDFSYDKSNCGVNVINAITAAGGALPTTSRYYRASPTDSGKANQENDEAIAIMVKYWNEHALQTIDYFPHIKEIIGNDPKNPFYGRHLVYKTIDGGSNQCPDTTKAAAIQAAQQDHAFMVFNNFDGAAYNMAANLNAENDNIRPMHYGTLWQSDQVYSKFAPYAWTQFATGSTITRGWASYVCSRLVGGKAERSPDATVAASKRKFGLVHTNLPQDKLLADEFKGYLTQFGCPKDVITKEVEYDGTNFSQAQQDNTNVIAQLRLAGVTTVLMLTEPVQPLFQMPIAEQQQYYPEWVYTSYGYSDSNTVQRLYTSVAPNTVKGNFGLSQLGVPGGFGFGAGDPFQMYHTYHQTAPDGKPCDPSSEDGMSHGEDQKNPGPNTLYCKAPGALVTWYYTLLPAIGGIFFAGPDLNAANVSAGLQNYPSTRYGGSGPTSDPRPALVGAGKDKYGFVVDATEWRWRPDFTSPKPEEKAGWVEYPDCQRHYILWPDQLAPNWEKDGPNYGAWCGDPKTGYPRILPEDSNG